MPVPRAGSPWTALLYVTSAGLYAAPALAYLDPGTGSMLLQGLIGAIAAAALTLRLYWHKVIGFFRSNKTDSDKSVADVSSEGDQNNK